MYPAESIINGLSPRWQTGSARLIMLQPLADPAAPDKNVVQLSSGADPYIERRTTNPPHHYRTRPVFIGGGDVSSTMRKAIGGTVCCQPDELLRFPRCCILRRAGCWPWLPPPPHLIARALPSISSSDKGHGARAFTSTTVECWNERARITVCEVVAAFEQQQSLR